VIGISQTRMSPATKLGLAEIPILLVERDPSSHRVARGRVLTSASSKSIYEGVIP
jgi:hypothetical protein